MRATIGGITSPGFTPYRGTNKRRQGQAEFSLSLGAQEEEVIYACRWYRLPATLVYGARSYQEREGRNFSDTLLGPAHRRFCAARAGNGIRTTFCQEIGS